VEICGDGWKTANGVLLFTYTPVITVSLASNSSMNIPLVARYHYPLSHYCSFGAVFALISFTNKITVWVFAGGTIIQASAHLYMCSFMHCPWGSLLDYDSGEHLFGCLGVSLT